MRNFIFLLLLMLVLSGCYTSTAYIKPSGSETIIHRDPKLKKLSLTPEQIAKAKKIIITEFDLGERKYKILADIEVRIDKFSIFTRDPSPEKVNGELRKEAVKIGADAVILVHYGTVGITFSSWGTLNGKGRAVVFVD